jgi:hypothetical protein
MIWHSNIDMEISAVIDILNSQYRKAVFCLANALEYNDGMDQSPNDKYELLHRTVWPIYALADWPKRPKELIDIPFITRMNDVKSIELAEGAGRIDIRPIGAQRTTIEFFTHDSGATQHLYPLVSLLKVQLSLMEGNFEFQEGDLKPIKSATFGLDVPQSPGEVLAIALLENLIEIVYRCKSPRKYVKFMESNGIDELSERTLILLGAKEPSNRNLFVRWVLRVLGILSLLLSGLWFLSSPGFEPLITLIGGIAAIISSFFVKDS